MHFHDCTYSLESQSLWSELDDAFETNDGRAYVRIKALLKHHLTHFMAGQKDFSWRWLRESGALCTMDYVWFMDEMLKEGVDVIIRTPDEVPSLGKDIAASGVLEMLFKRGMVPKRALKKDGIYLGSCRNATVAKWEGDRFIHWRCKCGNIFEEHINHPEDDDGYDVFVPIAELQAEAYVKPDAQWKDNWRHVPSQKEGGA